MAVVVIHDALRIRSFAPLPNGFLLFLSSKTHDVYPSLFNRR